MSNIYLKVITEKKWHTQNFNFINLKSFSPSHFSGSCNSYIYYWIFKLLIATYKSESGSKTVYDFSIILILKGIMTFWSQGLHAFFWLKKVRTENLTHNFRWMNLVLQPIKNCELKLKLWWVGPHERKMSAFFVTFYFSVGYFCFIFLFYLHV